MAREISSIILNANVITPRRVPAALSSTFDRLGNFLLPKMGVQMVVEFFEMGWLIFFSSMSDFRKIFGRPLFHTPRTNQFPRGDCNQPSEGSITWDFTLVRLPPRPPESTFVKLLKRFFEWTGSLHKGIVDEIVAPGAPTRYLIRRPSLAEYLRSAEELVKNTYDLYMPLHVK